MTNVCIYPPLLPLLIDANLYQLPINREEALLRSVVNRHIPGTLRRLSKAMLPSGRVRNGLLYWFNYVVALEEANLDQYGVTLQPGEWVDTHSLWHGRDLIELVAYGWRTTYSQAFEMVADHLGIILGAELNVHDKTARGWAQERNPLYPFFENALLQCSPEWFAYRNRMGTIFALGRKVNSPTGEAFPVFKTILKHQRTGRCLVVEAFPEKPFPLYHLDLIARNPGTPVVLCPDEGAADRCQQPGLVFSAIPGGPDNLLDADLACLEGRKVFVHLRLQDVCRGRLIERKLRDANVSEMHFIVDNGRALPFSELESISIKMGIELLPEPEARISSGALVALNLGTFLTTPLPPRGYILEWIIPEKGLVMVHAPRGVGKTHVALGIAYACATGTQFLNWRAPTARRVLYLDGEMSASDLQERLKSISSDEEKGAATNLRILNPDMSDRPMPDLSTEDGQKAVEPLLAGISLVVIDNLATLCRSGNENGGDSWLTIQSWLLDLRRRGISVLIVHHSAKNGGQRGTSRREDILDTIIRLQRPTDYDAAEGARFEVHLTKARHLHGDVAKPFEASLTTVNGTAEWVVGDIIDDKFEQACTRFEQGLGVRKTAAEIKVSKSTVSRWHQRWLADEGRLGGEARADDDDI